MRTKSTKAATHPLILHRGTFDVDNFGDALFPHLLRQRLRGLAVDLEIEAPVGGRPWWTDADWARPIVSARGASAVVVGGGNVIKSGAGGVESYERAGVADAYGLIWGSDPKQLCRIWMAVGVPRRPDRATTRRLRATALADYASARDAASVEWLAEAGHPAVCRPDAAFGVADLWPAPVEQRPWRVAGFGQPYVSVSLRSRDLLASHRDVARAIESIAHQLDACVVFLALGRCHGDVEVASAVRREIRDVPSYTANAGTLRRLCSSLAGALMHLGSSLHGGVVSASYNVPVIWITRMPEQGLPKLAGAMRWMPPTTRLVRSWAEASDAARGVSVGSPVPLPDTTLAMLRTDVDDIRSQITTRGVVS